MRPPTTFKKEFLKKWLMGLKLCSSSMKNMSLLQRKKTIKLSADVAMASARNGKTLWSKTFIEKASKQEGDDEKTKFLVEKILGNDFDENKLNRKTSTIESFTSKKILRRSCESGRIRKCATGRSPPRVFARSIAKRLMVKKRTQVLKSLVPGGESMNDDFVLLEETLDYILSLRAQVDVMRRVVNASSEVPNCK